MPIPTRPRRLAALAVGALALGGGVALAGTGGGGDPAEVALAGLVEDLSGPCDEAEHASDPRCTGTSRPEDDGRGGTTESTVPGSGSTITPTGPGASGTPIADEVRTIDAAGAGTVVVAVESGQLRLVAVHPADGWFVEVEHSAGREVEVDLTRGAVEVDVDVEIEDGRVRERVRVEDDAAGTEVRTEDGVVTRVEDDRSGSSDDDRSGSSDDDDDSDDRSGSSHDDDSDSSDDEDDVDGHGDDGSGSGDDDGTPDQGRGDR